MNNALQEPQTIVLLGGSSEIGRAIASKLLSPATSTLVLAGRNPDTLDPQWFASGDNTEVVTERFDADDVDSHEEFANRLHDTYGDIDVVIVAFGVLGAQAEIDDDPRAAAAVAHTNYTGAVSSITAFAAVMKAQGHGQIIVLSSVAGERGRASNYVYGSTKAGLDAFSQGLNDALHGTGVGITVVRPGFVHSKMTAGLPAAPLATTPDKVAEATVKALRSGAHTVWAPGPLRFVFAGLRHLPRSVFRRLDL